MSKKYYLYCLICNDKGYNYLFFSTNKTANDAETQLKNKYYDKALWHVSNIIFKNNSYTTRLLWESIFFHVNTKKELSPIIKDFKHIFKNVLGEEVINGYKEHFNNHIILCNVCGIQYNILKKKYHKNSLLHIKNANQRAIRNELQNDIINHHSSYIHNKLIDLYE